MDTPPKNEILEGITDDLVSKRKTIGYSGRSVSRTLNTVHRKPRCERVVGRVPFTKRFMRDFGHLVSKHNLRTDCDEDHRRRLPKRIEKFIAWVIPKYSESPDPDFAQSDRDYCQWLAHYFRDQRDRLHQLGITENQHVDVCKQFIEYGLFLRSLYGQKFIPIRLEHFLNVLNEEKRLDYREMSTELEPIRVAFNSPLSHQESLETIAAKFEPFIAYRISTTFGDEAENPDLLMSAHQALEEAVLKYNICSENTDCYLKLALQHIDLGLSEGYKRIKREKNSTQEVSGTSKEYTLEGRCKE